MSSASSSTNTTTTNSDSQEEVSAYKTALDEVKKNFDIFRAEKDVEVKYLQKKVI